MKNNHHSTFIGTDLEFKQLPSEIKNEELARHQEEENQMSEALSE